LCKATDELVLLDEDLQNLSYAVVELYVFQELKALLNGCVMTELSESKSSSVGGGISNGSGIGLRIAKFCKENRHGFLLHIVNDVAGDGSCW